jgi:glycosyltransferase involved in cell wall biosynthesis
MMMARESKASVFMVVAGNWKNEMPAIPTFVKSQVESLRIAGWEVTLGLVDDRTSVQGILQNVRRLRREVSRSRPRLVHAQYGSVTAAIANLIRGPLPLVVSFCGDDLLGTPSPGLHWRVRERCGRAIGLWAARRSATLIVKSDNLLRALPASLRDRAVLLPNGVDMGWFRPMAQDECRSRLGWNLQSKVVLFNASQNENQICKNPTLARAAVDLLAQSIPDVSLYMMSNASQEEVRLLLNAADSLLVTSLHEGSPNIVKEAMACNLPVVSVPCGDVPERLRMTHPGGVCSYDARVLAKALEEVLKAGSRSNGRNELIAQGLTAAKVAERLIQVYRQAQEQHSSIVRESA